MADMSRTLTVRITGETSGMRKGFNQAYREAQGFGNKMAVVGNQLKGMVGPALLGAAAAAGAFATKLAVDGVKAAMAEQKALAQLSTALNNVGQGFADAEVNTFIDDLQYTAAVADSGADSFARVFTWSHPSLLAVGQGLCQCPAVAAEQLRPSGVIVVLRSY
jgi:hypothetical protein